MSKQRGTFSYPGSKTLISPWILDYVPEHKGYIEPFGGAASLLVRKPRSELEVYNDINSDCVTFFRAVKHRGDELAEWVDNTPYSRELFNDYVEAYPGWPEDLIEHAGRFLYVQMAMFGGKVIGQSSATYSVTKPDNRRLDAGNEHIWARKPADIEWLKERFKHVNIEHLDFAEVVDKYDGENAFFYFDPPYVDVGDKYYQTEDGGFDHSRFVNTLHDLEGKWLVSYDQNIPPGLEDYRTVSRTKVARMSHQTPEKVETLTMNYEIDGEQIMSEYGQQTLGECYD